VRPHLHDVPDRIEWYEGMLLHPQHFEQLTLRQESLTQYHTLAAVPFSWGLRSLKVDEVQLLRGVFRVLEVEVVFPDGLAVHYDAGTGSPLEFDLSTLPDEAKRLATPIYLTVPALQSGQASGEASRYVSSGELPADDTDDVDTSVIPRLLPRLGLQAGPEPVASRFASVSLARVVYRREVWAIDDYVPPTGEVALDSPLTRLCAATVRRMRERAIYLNEQIRTLSASGRRQMEAQQLMRIRSLTAGLPAFEALLATGRTNPYVLFVEYCALAGHVAGLGASMIPPVFPPYDHKQLLESFSAVDQYINAILREGIPENYVGVPFSFADGVFSLTFEPEWATRRLILAVRCQAGIPDAETVAWAERCLIGSASRQRSMREKRVLGAARHYVACEEGLVAGQGVLLFSLAYDPDYIELNEVLQVVGISSEDRGVTPAELVLYVKYPLNKEQQRR
jgi:type VI secretion system protein ImpJ